MFEILTKLEFLRFLYCGQIDRNFAKFDQLISLADKYVQEDLHDKCISMLIHRITPSTFCGILDFAREHDIPTLKDWCIKLFPNHLSKMSITPLIKYLQREENEKDKDENGRMKEIVLDFVFGNLNEILEKSESKEDWKFYADFLLPYISKERIVKFTDLFKGKGGWGQIPAYLLSKEMAHLRGAIFHFVFTNLREKVGRWEYNFPANFYSLYNKYVSKRIQEEKEAALKKTEDLKALIGKMSIESKTESVNEGAQRKAIKRMEPSNTAVVEEEKEEGNGPTLKKNKQNPL